MELGHVIEVHAVDPRDSGGDSEDGRIGGQPAHIGILRHREQREVRFEGRSEKVLYAVDHLVNSQRVVVHVAEIRSGLNRNEILILESLQASGHFDDRRDHALQ